MADIDGLIKISNRALWKHRWCKFVDAFSQSLGWGLGALLWIEIFGHMFKPH